MYDITNLPYVSCESNSNINRWIVGAFDEFCKDNDINCIEAGKHFYILNIYFEYLDIYCCSDTKKYSYILPLSDCLLNLPLYTQQMNTLIRKSNKDILVRNSDIVVTDINTEIINLTYTQTILNKLGNISDYSDLDSKKQYYEVKTLHRKYKEHFLS